MLPELRSKHTGAYNLPSIVDEFFGKDFMSDFFGNQTGISMPSVNIIETGDRFKLEFAAPGYTKDDFTVDVHNNVLTISSKKESKVEKEEEKVMRREFGYSSFTRSFTLPNSVVTDNITAAYKEGILNVEIPKKEEAKDKPPKQIKIK